MQQSVRNPLGILRCQSRPAWFSDVLRMDHEKDGMSVTLLCPGFWQTRITRNAHTANGPSQIRDAAATAGGMAADRIAVKMIRVLNSKKFEVSVAGWQGPFAGKGFLKITAPRRTQKQGNLIRGLSIHQ